MSSLFSSSSSTNTTKSTKVPANVQAGLNQGISQLTTAAAQPYQAYTGQAVAQSSDAENQALAGLSSQYGMYQPLLQSANQSQLNMVQNGGAPTQADLDQFMNPYETDVLNTSLNALNNTYDQQMTKLGSGAGMAGAFGGDRYGVEAANLGQGFQQNVASTYYGGMKDAFDEAMQNWFNSQNLQQSENINASNMAIGGTNVDINSAKALSSLGANQRGIQQAGLNFDISQFEQAQADPMAKAQALTQGMAEYPYGILTTNQKSTQDTSPSLGSIIAGLGTSIAGAVGGDPLSALSSLLGSAGGTSASPSSGSGDASQTGYIPFAAPSFNSNASATPGVALPQVNNGMSGGARGGLVKPRGFARGGYLSGDPSLTDQQNTGSSPYLDTLSKQDMINNYWATRMFRRIKPKAGQLKFAAGGGIGPIPGLPPGMTAQQLSDMMMGGGDLPPDNYVPPMFPYSGKPQSYALGGPVQAVGAPIPAQGVQTPNPVVNNGIMNKVQNALPGNGAGAFGGFGLLSQLMNRIRPGGGQNSLKGTPSGPGQGLQQMHQGTSPAMFAGAQPNQGMLGRPGFAKGGKINNVDSLRRAKMFQALLKGSQQAQLMNSLGQQSAAGQGPDVPPGVDPSMAQPGYARGGKVKVQKFADGGLPQNVTDDPMQGLQFASPDAAPTYSARPNLAPSVKGEGLEGILQNVNDPQLRTLYRAYGARESGSGDYGRGIWDARPIGDDGKPMSSAFGLGQFTLGTWNQFAGQAGLPKWSQNLVDQGKLPSPQQQLKMMQTEAQAYRQALGNDADPLSLFIAHQAGLQGYKDLNSAKPDASVASVLSKLQAKNLGASNMTVGQFIAQRANWVDSAHDYDQQHYQPPAPKAQGRGAVQSANPVDRLGDIDALASRMHPMPSGPVQVPGIQRTEDNPWMNTWTGDPTLDAALTVPRGYARMAYDLSSLTNGPLPSDPNKAFDIIDQGDRAQMHQQKFLAQNAQHMRATGHPLEAKPKSLDDLFGAEPAASPQGNYLDNQILRGDKGPNLPSVQTSDLGMTDDMTSSSPSLAHIQALKERSAVPLPSPLSLPQMILPHIARNLGIVPRMKPTPGVKRTAGKQQKDNDAYMASLYAKFQDQQGGAPGAFRAQAGYAGGGYVKGYAPGGEVSPEDYWGETIKDTPDTTNLGHILNTFGNIASAPARASMYALDKLSPSRVANWLQQPNLNVDDIINKYAAMNNAPQRPPAAPPAQQPVNPMTLAPGGVDPGLDPLTALTQKILGSPDSTGDTGDDGKPDALDTNIRTLLNRNVQQMVDRSQENSGGPPLGLFPHANEPLLKFGLAMLANSDRNFGAAVGTAGLATLQDQQQQKLQSIKERDDQIKDLINTQYQRSAAAQADPKRQLKVAAYNAMAKQAAARQQQTDRLELLRESARLKPETAAETLKAQLAAMQNPDETDVSGQ